MTSRMLNIAQLVVLGLALFALVLPAAAQPATPGAGTAGGTRSLRENPAVSIQDLVRIEGQASSPLRGAGIVTGLNKTGDSGSELALARPMAQVYANNGIPLADVSELAKGKAAALVTLSALIPEKGGRKGDRFDVIVTISHSASSLAGGRLEIAPLLHPLPGSPDPVYGFAEGLIELDNPAHPTTGRIRNGFQLVRDVKMKTPIHEGFNLIVREWCRGYPTTRMIASEINGLTADLENSDENANQIAEAVDDTVVRITIPEHERGNPSGFIASVLTKRFSPSLLDLPAQVIVNRRLGTILVTGDVEISTVTIGNDKLVITTVMPSLPPSPTNPEVSRTNLTQFGTAATTAERARIQDLLEAFKQLNVPTVDQIDILAQISRSGRLHAQLIFE